MQNKSRLILITSVMLWAAIIGFGLHQLWRYESDPGIAEEAPSHWPSSSKITPPHSATLVMFAHPRCPCTRASIGELALLMTRCQSNLTAYVLFYKPKDSPADWDKTDLWYSAADIPGVNVIDDEDGLEARRFHAVTSGHTIVYDAKASLLFSGGITASRGHSGDNDGRSSIVSLLTEGASERAQTLTFGCLLYDPNSECVEGAAKCDR